MFWKFVARWISAVSVAREIVERRVGERRRAVLHGAGEPVLVARHLREVLERVEIELHVGDRAVGEHHAAVRRARLHADLRKSHQSPGVRARPATR